MTKLPCRPRSTANNSIFLRWRPERCNCFLHKAGSVVSPVEIATHVQGRGDDATTNSVEAMIARLRKKLGADAILTRRGFGYYIPGNAG